MSMTPPPGWYRDPHAPHRERWWDGTAWTGHRRPPEAPAVPPVPSAGGTGGTGGGGSGGADGTGRAKAVALTTAGAVLVAAVVTGVVVLGGDDGDPETRTGPAVTGTVSATEPPFASPTAQEPPTDDPDIVEDQLNGVTFPLIDGWVRPEHIAQDDVVMTTDGTYDCPGEGSVCRHGLVISRTVTESDTASPEELAKDDIPDAADDAFDEDTLGQRPYGGLTSHKVVKSGPVAVAGRAGYFVRWRVTTAKGPGGYVQSTVFPSSVGTGSPVLVRYVFEAGEDGPPLADMDRITKGIRAVTDEASGGGVGSSIGPTD